MYVHEGLSRRTFPLFTFRDVMSSMEEVGLTRVWIDDRHPIFRHGVRSILADEGFCVVGESAAFRPDPDALSFDLLFFEADSWGLQHAVKMTQGTECRLIALVDEAEERLITDLAEAGTSAIIFRNDLSREKLITALRAVVAGNSALPANLLSRMLERAALGANGGTGQLSDRELSVLKLLSQGEDTNDIAAALAYSARTVKNIVHDALVKMNCRNRAHAVAQATRQGLI